jgi:hypothetical protein
MSNAGILNFPFRFGSADEPKSSDASLDDVQAEKWKRILTSWDDDEVAEYRVEVEVVAEEKKSSTRYLQLTYGDNTVETDESSLRTHALLQPAWTERDYDRLVVEQYWGTPFETTAIPVSARFDPARLVSEEPEGGATSASTRAYAGPVSFDDANSTMRVGGLAGLALIFCSIPVLLLSVGVALTLMFLGAAIFALANYTAYRKGEHGWIIGPLAASRAFAGSLFLAVVALVAAITSTSP